MPDNVIPFRPRQAPREPYICPCGSEYFSTHYKVDMTGHTYDRKPYATCDGCGTTHQISNQRTP